MKIVCVFTKIQHNKATTSSLNFHFPFVSCDGSHSVHNSLSRPKFVSKVTSLVVVAAGVISRRKGIINFLSEFPPYVVKFMWEAVGWLYILRGKCRFSTTLTLF